MLLSGNRLSEPFLSACLCLCLPAQPSSSILSSGGFVPGLAQAFSGYPKSLNPRHESRYNPPQITRVVYLAPNKIYLLQSPNVVYLNSGKKTLSIFIIGHCYSSPPIKRLEFIPWFTLICLCLWAGPVFFFFLSKKLPIHYNTCARRPQIHFQSGFFKVCAKKIKKNTQFMACHRPPSQLM